MDRVKKFFTSTEAPRWHTYAVSLATVAFTVIFTLVGNSWKNKDDVRISDEKALTDSMIQFQVHAASFAASIMDKTGDAAKAKAVLLENLNEQFARAKQTEIYGGSHLQVWRNYEDAILHLHDVIENTNAAEHMGPFWTATSKLLVARNRLREQIQRIT